MKIGNLWHRARRWFVTLRRRVQWALADPPYGELDLVAGPPCAGAPAWFWVVRVKMRGAEQGVYWALPAGEHGRAQRYYEALQSARAEPRLPWEEHLYRVQQACSGHRIRRSRRPRRKSLADCADKYA